MSEDKLNEQSSATLICDYSVNDLNQLLFTYNEQTDNSEMQSNQTSPIKTSSKKQYKAAGSPDKYNQLIKLDDEEENVDFMAMFNQFQQENQMQNAFSYQQSQLSDQGSQAQVMYYQPQTQQPEAISERVPEESFNPYMQPQVSNNQNIQPAPPKKGKKGVRPSSATVAGQTGRFLNNLQSKKKYGAHTRSIGDGSNQVDQYSYSYLNQASHNNPVTASHSNIAKVGQPHSNMPMQGYGPMFSNAQSLKPPMPKRRPRPQSAAKNQMQPAKELQSVTNFTYQKAKQIQNKRQFIPDSMKNTDKEKLYEDKINLKKKLNDLLQENQQLKTQAMAHQALIKKKEDMVQALMSQMLHPSSTKGQEHPNSQDYFLQEFKKREIQHSLKPQIIGLSSKPSRTNNIGMQAKTLSKESQIIQLKQKMKEMNDILQSRERELYDLKKTLKFTRIKEYESELALNVQETQRLRDMLENEMRKPKIDPRLVVNLKQSIVQYQSIIQNLQTNQQISQENNDKLNKKLIAQVKKFAKQKEARKRLAEKNQRLEKKLVIMTNKANTPPVIQQVVRPKQNMKQYDQAIQNLQNTYQERFEQQNNFIEKLLLKMESLGIQINEEELDQLQMEVIQEDQDENQRSSRQEEIAESPLPLDLIITLGKDHSTAKQVQGINFENLDELKGNLRKQFDIRESGEFQVKFLDVDGNMLDLTSDNFEQMKSLGTQSQIQLEIEMLNDPSNYEEEEFEEQVEPANFDPVTESQVKDLFKEMKIVLQIKEIKHGDALKFILHGVKEGDKNSKVKYVSINTLKSTLKKQVGFSEDNCLLLARYLVESKDEETGKVKSLENAEFKGQEHNDACKIIRKELCKRFMEALPDYAVYNGFAITSLLTRIQSMFQEYRVELGQELDDQDYEDTKTTPMSEIYKTMKLVGMFPNQFDQEVTDFLEFMAMRYSASLNEIVFADFMNIFDEDYSYIDDKKSRWERDEEDYQASDDGVELESKTSEEPIVESSPQKSLEIENSLGTKISQGEELEQNVLLEKVDEILMQIVQKLPDQNKIKTLTQCMMPYLTPVYDQDQQKQSLIISQNAFIQFLFGQGQNQMGLMLDEGHIICLLHLLVQENEHEGEEEDSTQRYILFDEFIELVKTYMKKELIMKQSKSLGINYDILCKESVEFLFQIRSSLMHENMNEQSEDEYRQSSKMKSVPSQIREIFQRIITSKSIQLQNQGHGKRQNSNVEVMDFDQMLEILYIGLGIHYPSTKSQEELKYLMCLDLKYLEMVMLVKFDKVMQDLDYISIDLLRQAQERSMNEQRKMNLNHLRQKRDKLLSNLKIIQAKRAAKNNEQIQESIYGSGQMQEFQGVSQSSKQEKKKKRPDDRRQPAKKMGSQKGRGTGVQRSNYDQDFNEGNVNVRYSQRPNAQTEPHHEEFPEEGIEDMYPMNDFDNIDVNEDRDINKKQKLNEKSEENISEVEEDYLQDDIPIDEDDDDGIISDNYENLDDKKEKEKKPIIPQPEPPVEDDNIISIDHSDDIQQSRRGEMEIEKSHQSMVENEISDQPEEDEPEYDENEEEYEDLPEEGMEEEMEMEDHEEMEDEGDMESGINDEIDRRLYEEMNGELDHEMQNDMEEDMDELAEEVENTFNQREISNQMIQQRQNMEEPSENYEEDEEEEFKVEKEEFSGSMPPAEFVGISPDIPVFHEKPHSSRIQNESPPDHEEVSEPKEETFDENQFMMNSGNRKSGSRSSKQKFKGADFESDQYQDEFNENESGKYSQPKSNSHKSLSKHSSPIAQDIKAEQAVSEIEDFGVELPHSKSNSKKGLGTPENEELDEYIDNLSNNQASVEKSEKTEKYVLGGPVGESSVQVVDDKFYIEDEFDDLPAGKLPENPSKEKLKPGKPPKEHKEQESEEEDYEF